MREILSEAGLQKRASRHVFCACSGSGWRSQGGDFMATETDFLYLVLLILMTFVLHIILSHYDRRNHGH
jgi:hypothetical protein